MVALSLTIALAIITLTPAAGAVVVFVLGRAGYATRRLTRTVATLAGIIPAAGALFLAPDLGFGAPIDIRPFGLGSGFGTWLVPTLRIDALAGYAAIAIVLLAMPMLLWLSFAADSTPTSTVGRDEKAQVDDAADALPAEPAVAPAESSAADAGATSEPHAAAATQADMADVVADDGGGDALSSPADHDGARELAADPDFFEPQTKTQPGWREWIGMAALEDRRAVRGVVLSLLLVSAALIGLFADSIVLLGVAWIAVAALAWGLGEVASGEEGLDFRSLVICLVGPLLWLGTLLVSAELAQDTGLLELTGRTALSSVGAILVALAVALAAGAYPALAWLRRRAALAAPAGIAALAMVALPVALYVAARTYSAASDSSNAWPLIGPSPTTSGGPPPITAGFAFVLLGAATVAIAGLLALGRRDGRALVALLAAAQAGWGLVALGVGGAQGMQGLTLLLPALLLGLGAMIASLVAGGALTEDVEPEADGPRPVGERLRGVTLAAWAVGAASLIGMPLLPGFAARQLITQSALVASGLNVALVALCWAGDALLALALVRATAPALAGHPSASPILADARDIPGSVAMALLVAMGAFPGVALSLFGVNMAQSLLSPTTLSGAAQTSVLGFTATTGQWLSAIAWLAILAGVAAVLLLQPGTTRRPAPAFIGGHDEETAAGEPIAGALSAGEEPEAWADESTADEDALDHSVGVMSEPADAWSALARTFTSSVLLPGAPWLLAGMDDDESGEAEATAVEEGDDGDEADEGEERNEVGETEASGETDEQSQAAEEMPVPARADEVTRGDD